MTVKKKFEKNVVKSMTHSSKMQTVKIIKIYIELRGNKQFSLFLV